jgi:hypothetical protein
MILWRQICGCLDWLSASRRHGKPPSLNFYLLQSPLISLSKKSVPTISFLSSRCSGAWYLVGSFAMRYAAAVDPTSY